LKLEERLCNVEPRSVILDHGSDQITPAHDQHGGAVGLGVAHDVGQGLLHHPINNDLDLGG
jgi:hypothetical protein